MAPPVAPKIPRSSTRHGETVVDDYFWLRQRDDPEVTAYLAAENAYAEGIVAGTGDLQERLYREMLGRIKETDLSVPYRKGKYWYYARTEEGRQYPILARKRGSLDSAEEIILDLNALARDTAYFAVDSFSVSDDGDWLAYSVDTTGSREYTLRLRDLRRGVDEAETFPRVSSVAWSADGRSIFYVTDDDAKRPYRLWRLDRREKSSVLLFEENDERFSFMVRRSRSQRYLFLDVDSHTASEVRFLKADDPSGTWTVALARATDIEYEIEHGDDLFWIRINDRGRNFRVVQCTPDDVRPEAWREIIPHRPEVHVAAVEPFRGWLVVYEREDGLERYVLRHLGTGTSHAVAFPEPTYATFPDINAEYETTRFRFRYQSLITPPSVFEYDMETRERTLLKRTEVLGGYDADRYATERVHAVSGDGTRVPISIVYRKDTPRDGTAPLHIVGYGAYGYPLPVMFSSNRLSLLDRGVVCALVHVRGGGELGQTWHDAGRMASKTASFADFIAGADELIMRRYGARERTIVEGASAGGLLIGAVLNARPDLAGGAILKVPFVDVINTMLDTSLPLTVGEFEEWGNPAEPAHYAIMRAYCPYTNLARRPYPAMLVKTSLHDSQVMYWESAKYVARLRALNADGRALLFHINLEAGHGGASGRYDHLREIAFDYVFILTELGRAG